jgi:zinc transport system permease protein
MQGYNVDLFGYLFGSILAVSQNDVWIILGLSAAVLLLVLPFFKEWAR